MPYTSHTWTTGDSITAALLNSLEAGAAGAYNVLGSASNPVTSASAARPTGLTKVFWQCSTQPTNWLAGDEWINNS